MKKLLVILMLAIAVTGYSQKIKIIEGDLAPLKGQTAIKLEFTYDNLTIGKKNKPEAEYVAEKKAEHNKKEAGKGDEWEAKWNDNKPNVFEPKFRELFAKESGMTTADANPTYTLIFKTTNLEPGYKIGLSTVPAYIDAEAWIVETANKDKVIAKITVANSPGAAAFGFLDFDSGSRVAESYAKAGKELGHMIAKKTK
jgi:hypothetical protein